MFRHLSSIIRTSLRCSIQCNRMQNIQKSAVTAVKLFMDTENRHAHNVLEQSLKKYQIFRLETEQEIQLKCNDFKESFDMVLNPSKNGQAITSSEAIQLLRSLVYFLQQNCDVKISDERFTPFTQLFCNVSSKLSDDQLLEALGLLANIPEIESVKENNYLNLWNALDVEFCCRIDDWDIDQLLKACDAWYNLNLARITEFVRGALRKLGRKIRRMSPEQLVQLLFFCNLTRSPLYEMFDLEENLMQCIDEMSLNELGVISMGFFKTKTPLKSPILIEQMYKRLMPELDTVDDITLVAILKLLRYSTKLKQADLAMQLMEGLIIHVDRFSVLCCLHIALLGSDMQCCNDELLERILKRFSDNIDQTRLKDLERICFAIGVFNSNSPSGIEEELCAKILPTLKTRFDEIIRHPRSFLNCIHFLTLRGFYDKEMISAALEKRFIHHAYGKNARIGREIFQLDSFARINLKDENYDGNLLSDKMRSTMGKMLTHYIPERNSKYKMSLADGVLLDVKETTDRIARFNCFKHVLPHYERPDVVFCFDKKQRKALPIASSCAEDYSGVILTREQLIGDRDDMSDIATVVLSVAGWNNMVREKDRHTCLFDMKLKQLSLLGHKSVVIYWYEWRRLETQADRYNYLRRKLSTVINL